MISIGLVPLPFTLAVMVLRQPRPGTVAFIYLILVLLTYKTV